MLRDMVKTRKAKTQSPLNKTHKLKHQDWARKSIITDFLKVLWAAGMSVTLDRPDEYVRCWIRSNGHRAPL